jgi:hypothetical protein
MHARRTLLNRIALWMTGVVLALTVYLATQPFLFYLCGRQFPRAIPALLHVYAPARIYCDQEWIGTTQFAEYSYWGFYTLAEYHRGDERSNEILDESSTIQFSGTPLRDVIGYLSEVHAYPIEPGSEVDGDVEITVNLNGPLRNCLQTILESHGLTAWPANKRIVIGTPAAVQRIRADERARRRVAPLAWIILGILCTGGGGLVHLLRQKSRTEQRGARSVGVPETTTSLSPSERVD